MGLLGGNNCYQYAPNPTGWVDPLGLTCKENTWNAFQKDHKGMFKSPAEASAAYQDLKNNQSPWPIGYDHTQNVRTMMPGETFNMIVDEGREDMPGRFGTTDNIPDSQYGRQNLAIKEEWKPTLDNVVTYEVLEPFDVYAGPVGPQIDGSNYLAGGGTQITFVDDKDWSTARPNKYNGNTSKPKLAVKGIRELDNED
jgi:uncharacterized protein RhaS with RHS repeats